MTDGYRLPKAQLARLSNWLVNNKSLLMPERMVRQIYVVAALKINKRESYDAHMDAAYEAWMAGVR